MSSSLRVLLLSAIFSMGLGACASAPSNPSEQSQVLNTSRQVLRRMTNVDPSLDDVLETSAGYAMFPNVGEGAFVIGAALADGAVFEKGKVVGYARLSKGTVGPQVGGQTYSQLIVFKTPEALRRLKSGNFDLSADASATALQSGVSASANFEGGTQVFIYDEKGLMAQAAIGGQQITFEPR